MGVRMNIYTAFLSYCDLCIVSVCCITIAAVLLKIVGRSIRIFLLDILIHLLRMCVSYLNENKSIWKECRLILIRSILEKALRALLNLCWSNYRATRRQWALKISARGKANKSETSENKNNTSFPGTTC